jgi:hypothetical protein
MYVYILGMSNFTRRGKIHKISIFLQISGFLNSVLKPYLFQRQSVLKVYSILAITSHLYGCEMWISKNRGGGGMKTKDSKGEIHEKHIRVQFV